ncbi:MAG: TolB family protein [Thermoleophilia bacterium]
MSSISADGNYIAFISDANNLVPEDINNVTDVFVADSHTGDIRLVSTDSNGIQGNCGSLGPSISADGRFVAFVSCASNLGPDDTNGDPDIFLKDIQTGTTTRVSTDSGGNQANPTLYQNGSNACTISGDGRYVAFQSFASNLVSGDTNSTCDVFIKDTQINQTTRVSTDSAGAQVYGLSQAPSISGDGRYTVFIHGSDLIPGGYPGIYDIFVKDSQTGITSVISTDSTGGRANGPSGDPSISPNGRYVTFESDASNLGSGGSGIFIKDIQTDQTTRVSNDYATGGQPDGNSSHPSVSNNGHVVFWSFASNLVPGDITQCNSFGTIYNCADVFVWDKESGITTIISTDISGDNGNDDSGGIGDIFLTDRSITADGRFVVLESNATNLVPGDTNGARDIFLASATATTKRTYWSWYDALSPGARNWVLMANVNSSVWNQGFGLDIGNQAMDLSPFTLSGGDCPSNGCAPGEVPLGMTITPSFPGMMGGPVVARSQTDENSILTSQRVLWGDSLEEVPGISEEKLSDHYYWPWYDQQSPGFTNWVVVANPGYATVYYGIKIDGQVMDSGSIVAGSHVAPTFPGVISGPVEVQAWSDQVGGSSPAKVIASQRVLSDYGKAFNEEPGISAADLSDHYLWPWYDSQSPGAQDWVLLTNPGAAAVQYSLKIAGYEVASGSLEAAGAQYGLDKVELSFPGSMGGPVEVTATGNVIASQRSLWGPSFEEAPGYPYSLLASSYHWTWYDSLSEGAENWVMLANPNPGPVDYTVRIAGSVITNGTLQAAGDPGGGDMATPIFSGMMAGPVEVSSTGGNVVASQRVLWSGHFNEVWGTVLE